MTLPLLAIDGDNFVHRAFHALPKTIRRGDGQPAGAIVGFANFLLRLIEQEKPRAVVVAWDTLETPNFRQRLLPAYQSGREFDPALIRQLSALPEFVTACGFANAKAPGFEADDFLASAAAGEERRGGITLVATGDRDAFQLASAATTILHPVKAGALTRIGPAEVRERYGVAPHQVPDFIALRGDPSDNLPGARGIGAKTAAALLDRFGTLEAILADGRFGEEAEVLRLYKRIATMDTSAPLPPQDDQVPAWDSAAALAREWGLERLARRLETAGGSGRGDPPAGPSRRS